MQVYKTIKYIRLSYTDDKSVESDSVLVFMNGHVGVYIGNGEVIEARGHEYGVVKTKLKSRPRVNWGTFIWLHFLLHLTV